jgi:hypothetical protein
LAIISTLALLFTTSRGRAEFWWILTGFIAVLGMQIVFWSMTQPVNRYWIRNQSLSGLGARFFSVDRRKQSPEVEVRNDNEGWKRFRDRWEYSHVIRAVLSAIALIAVVVAVAF